MSTVTRLVLDVLKPHQPNALAFATKLADLDPQYHVQLSVQEVDEQTESVVLHINGEDIDFEKLTEQIRFMGGSVHSIDEVHVRGEQARD